MPQSIIDAHPDRTKIIADILSGQSVRDIAGQYGISKSVVQRYKETKIPNLIEDHNTAKNLIAGDGIIDYLVNNLMGVMEKMQRSVDDYLQHPTNPDFYHLGPHAGEVEVVYLEGDEEEGMINRTATLQELLDKAEKDKVIVSQWKYRHEDPRRMFFNNIDKLLKALELLAKLHGQLVTKHELSGQAVIVLKPGQVDIPDNAGVSE